jgi:hypothetical protein
MISTQTEGIVPFQKFAREKIDGWAGLIYIYYIYIYNSWEMASVDLLEVARESPDPMEMGNSPDLIAMGSGGVLRSESHGVDRSEIGGSGLPCSKSLRKWAKSRFEQWRLHSEQQLSDTPLNWSQKNSKFSVAQVIAWFEFKDKKYKESRMVSGADSNLEEPSTYRQFFGCTGRYHSDPDFINIFRKPLAGVTGKKRKERCGKRIMSDYFGIS